MKPALIKKINIVGNKMFDEEDLLDEFELSTGGWLSRFTRDNQYSRPKLAGDLEALRSYYLDRGYVNFKIDSTQVTITPDKKDIYITININEGAIYTISDIRLAGDLVGDAEEYFPLIPPAPWRAVCAQGCRREQRPRVGETVRSRTCVRQRQQRSPRSMKTKDGGDHLSSTRANGLRPAHQHPGQSRTRDEVVRREFRQMESAWFSGENSNCRVAPAAHRLFRQMYRLRPVGTGVCRRGGYQCRVDEKPSGSLLAGLGYSQSDGVISMRPSTRTTLRVPARRCRWHSRPAAQTATTRYPRPTPYYTIDGISRGFDLIYKSTDFDELDTADYKTDDGIVGMSFGIPLSEFNRFNFGLGVASHQFRGRRGTFAGGPGLPVGRGNEFLDFEDHAQLASRFAQQRDLPGPVRCSPCSVKSASRERSAVLQDFVRASPLLGADQRFRHIVNGEIAYGDAMGHLRRTAAVGKLLRWRTRQHPWLRARSVGPRDSQGDSIGGNAMYASFELLFPLHLHEEQ